MARPELDRVAEVVEAMAEVIPFFPNSEVAQRIITNEIYKFVGSKEELKWFGNEAITKLSKYESIPHLRAFFCTQFSPADGVQPTVDIPGYTTEDLEAKYIARDLEERSLRFESYREQGKLAPAEDREPFLLPEARKMP